MPETPIEKMKKFEAEYERLQELVRDAECNLEDLNNYVEELVRETIAPMFPEMDRDGVTYLLEWGWQCEEPDKNPFPLCVYDKQEDPCLDNCLFCHQPQERK
jgi:hypothetical protein